MKIIVSESQKCSCPSFMAFDHVRSFPKVKNGKGLLGHQCSRCGKVWMEEVEEDRLRQYLGGSDPYE